MTLDLYRVLEIERTASPRQIRSAYRRLARTYHPDANPEPDAAERFKLVAEAYAVLSDAARRLTYDRTGTLHTQAAAHLEVEDSAFE